MMLTVAMKNIAGLDRLIEMIQMLMMKISMMHKAALGNSVTMQKYMRIFQVLN